MAKLDFKGRPTETDISTDCMMLTLLLFLYLGHVFGHRFGFYIDDATGRFESCNFVQFGTVSEAATEAERLEISETFNHLFRANWKAKYIYEEDPGFESKLKPLRKLRSSDPFHEIIIEGEMNSFLALLKIQMATTLDPLPSRRHLTFYKSPMLVCSPSAAKRLLKNPEMNIKLAAVAIETVRDPSEIIDHTIIDTTCDFVFEIPRYESSGTLNEDLLPSAMTRAERPAKLRRRQRRCLVKCTDCCNIS